MKKSLIALVAFVSIATFSCKKEDKQENPVATKENIAGTYTIGSYKMQTGTSAEQDVTVSVFEPCQLDDMTTFKTDLTFTVVDAGTQCSPATDESGSWDLPTSTSMVFDGETFTIKSWNGKELVLTQTDNSSGTIVTSTLTINKQ